ncbi:MAG: hypothetical protein K6T57_15185 [Thermaceae bacterium]|nr:hypothetical protein [Thermaceae bacterium]
MQPVESPTGFEPIPIGLVVMDQPIRIPQFPGLGRREIPSLLIGQGKELVFSLSINHTQILH